VTYSSIQLPPFDARRIRRKEIKKTFNLCVSDKPASSYCVTRFTCGLTLVMWLYNWPTSLSRDGPSGRIWSSAPSDTLPTCSGHSEKHCARENSSLSVFFISAFNVANKLVPAKDWKHVARAANTMSVRSVSLETHGSRCVILFESNHLQFGKQEHGCEKHRVASGYLGLIRSPVEVEMIKQVMYQDRQ